MGESKSSKGWSSKGYGRKRLNGDKESKRKDEEGVAEERQERDLEETLDRERHGSGEYDPEESYGRLDVFPDRENAGPGDEELPDSAEDEPKRGRSPRKQGRERR